MKKDKENLFEVILKKKLKLKKKKELSEMGMSLNNFGLQLDKVKIISDHYDPAANEAKKKELVFEIQTETLQKFWDKNNVVKLQRKNNKSITFDTKSKEL